MSLRVVFCTLYVLFFAFYAIRNWRVSLGAVIILMAFFQHPDMPKMILGIQGMNLWNILMGAVILGWLAGRHREGLQWDMPRGVRRLLILYMMVMVGSVLRLLAHPSDWENPSFAWMVSEYLINCLKWILPGLILFDSCRTRRQIIIGLFCVLGLYFLLAAQIAKHMPPSYAVADNFAYLAYKIVQESVGYNRVTLSMMLAGASWAMLALLPLAQQRRHKLAVLAAAGLVAYGQALTAGRSGYVGWAATGLILCMVKWRKLLPLIPLGLVAICAVLPGMRERIFQGVGVNGAANDAYEMTSGRNIAWPYVIAKIKQGPILGFGREAMATTGLYQTILYDTGGNESFPHPHNAYLEILLDCGVVGFVVVVLFYLAVLRRAFSLFCDASDPLYSAAGGVACALVLALLVSAMGGETFYARESAVGMWAAIGLMLRVSVEREDAVAAGSPTIANAEDPAPEDEETLAGTGAPA